jgi:biopolymer transport protein ExbB/TolQ
MPLFSFPVVAMGLDFALSHSSASSWIVCGLILVLSVMSWLIIAMKLHLLRTSQAGNGEFLQVFRHSSHPLFVFQAGEHFETSPLYHIYQAAARELAFHLVGVDQPDRTFSQRLQGAGKITSSQANAIRRCMERAMNEACVKVESKVGLVAMAVSGAPILGLLGTVWGIMEAFGSLASAQGDVPVQAVTPGVAAALLTTLLGLLVALPSLVGYNMLVSRLRAMTLRLENFVCEMGTALDRYYVDHRAPADEIPSLSALGPPSVVSYASTTGTPFPQAGPPPA